MVGTLYGLKGKTTDQGRLSPDLFASVGEEGIRVQDHAVLEWEGACHPIPHTLIGDVTVRLSFEQLRAIVMVIL